MTEVQRAVLKIAVREDPEGKVIRATVVPSDPALGDVVNFDISTLSIAVALVNPKIFEIWKEMLVKIMKVILATYHMYIDKVSFEGFEAEDKED